MSSLRVVWVTLLFNVQFMFNTGQSYVHYAFLQRWGNNKDSTADLKYRKTRNKTFYRQDKLVSEADNRDL